MTTPTIAPPCYLDPARPRDRVEEDFWRFHRKNPEIFTRLKMLALRVKAKGIEHYSIAALFEILRYESMTTTGSHFKLPNAMRSCYARLLAQESPQLRDFFTFARRRCRHKFIYED